MTNPTEFIKLSDMMMGGSSGVVIIGFFMWMKIKENTKKIERLTKIYQKIDEISQRLARMEGKMGE